MRLIDADAFREELLRKGFYPVIVAKTLERQPTVEAVPVHGNKMQDFNNDLIRRTDALNMIHNFFKLKMDSVCGEREEIPMGELDPFLEDNKELAAKIKSIPNFEAAPVVHGEWAIKEDENCFATWDCCSVCGFEMGFAHTSHYAKFCPNCGAKMDGKAV